MTPRGGAREGAGRPPRTEPKSRPIWCGQMAEQDLALILTLTPDERYDALMDAVAARGFELEAEAERRGRMCDGTEQVDVEKAQELAVDGLFTDGEHYKQWYLERVLEALGVDLHAMRLEQHEEKWLVWDEGIAP